MLMAACGPVRQQAVRTQTLPAKTQVTVIAPEALPITAPPITATKTVAPADYSVVRFNTLSDAVDSIITDNIRVAAFAEIHKSQNTSLVSTLQHFAPEVMPLLAAKGINDLVFEALPSGSQAEAEANKGIFGPVLRDWYAFAPDYCGVKGTIQLARSNGIKLHGANFESVAEQHAKLNQSAVMINERTLATAQALLAKGQRVALYNGLDHNSIECLPGLQSRCFGSTLHDQLGSGYVEIDLLIPELAQNIDPRNIDFGDWYANIPDQGVNLITLSSGRNLIIFPRSASPVVSVFPEKAPSCH